jgi:hypothetical protein
MISRTEAERRVLEHLNRHAAEAERAAIVRSIPKSYGWVVLYDAAAFVEGGDETARFYGNGPCVVLATGEMHQLGSARPVDEELAAFEAEYGRDRRPC